MADQMTLTGSLLYQKLSRWQNQPDPVRLALVGVGQIMRSDDGAGPAVIRRLVELLPIDDNLLLLDGGHAPENCLGPIIRFKPRLILFIDAVRSAVTPGSILWLAATEAVDMGGSTHTLSLAMLAEYLERETAASVSILGIQPGNTSFGEGLADEVDQAVQLTANIIAAYWRNANAASSAIKAGETSVVNA